MIRISNNLIKLAEAQIAVIAPGSVAGYAAEQEQLNDKQEELLSILDDLTYEDLEKEQKAVEKEVAKDSNSTSKEKSLSSTSWMSSLLDPILNLISVPVK
jgi:hypothetical protein